ncbi:MAG: hypothetical protein LC733_07740 [Actinobacteria bacterium]|nr:hypothetical protein [Actinomycetota bacterium]
MNHAPGTVPSWWTMSYPQVSSVADATAHLDRLGGSMSRAQVDSKWVLSTGDQALFEAETQQELDGFVLGFTLSQLIAARFGPIGSTPPAAASAAPITTSDTAAAQSEVIDGDVLLEDIVEGEIVEGEVIEVVEGEPVDGELSESPAAPDAEDDPEAPTS